MGRSEINAGIAYLMKADELVGHNIVSLTLSLSAELHPTFNTTGIKVTDTLVLSRSDTGDLRNDDHAAGYTLSSCTSAFYGSHSLKAWGLRLGVLKGILVNHRLVEWTGNGNYCAARCAGDRGVIAIWHRRNGRNKALPSSIASLRFVTV